MAKSPKLGWLILLPAAEIYSKLVQHFEISKLLHDIARNWNLFSQSIWLDLLHFLEVDISVGSGVLDLMTFACIMLCLFARLLVKGRSEMFHLKLLDIQTTPRAWRFFRFLKELYGVSCVLSLIIVIMVVNYDPDLQYPLPFENPFFAAFYMISIPSLIATMGLLISATISCLMCLFIREKLLIHFTLPNLNRSFYNRTGSSPDGLLIITLVLACLLLFALLASATSEPRDFSRPISDLSRAEILLGGMLPLFCIMLIQFYNSSLFLKITLYVLIIFWFDNIVRLVEPFIAYLHSKLNIS